MVTHAVPGGQSFGDALKHAEPRVAHVSFLTPLAADAAAPPTPAGAAAVIAEFLLTLTEPSLVPTPSQLARPTAAAGPSASAPTGRRTAAPHRWHGACAVDRSCCAPE
jgi:hypothetical protein